MVYQTRIDRKRGNFIMSKKLVAYFSATGITKKVAVKLAEYIDADMHEIVPEIPYTKEDLDWTNKKHRNAEQVF